MDIAGKFSTAILNGGTGNNTLVVGTKTGFVHVGSTNYVVTPWTGDVTLDNRGNSTGNANVEYYIVNPTGFTAPISTSPRPASATAPMS